MSEPKNAQTIEQIIEQKLDGFAVIVNKGFSEVHTEIADVRSEMHSEAGGLRSEIRSEFADVRSEMRENFAVVNQRIDKLYNLIDGFIQLHQKLDQELTMLRARMDRLEGQIQQLQAQRA